MIFNMLIKKYRLRKLNKEFQRINKNTNVYLERETKIDLIKVGKYTYGPIYTLIFNKESKLMIGNYCSIAPKASFILSADHDTNYISTFPFRVKVLGIVEIEGVSKGDIIIDDDVWIGYGAIILSGVHIGQGAVIAAGAVVTSDIPPYAIAGGVPAKVIKYRFEPSIIDYLLTLDYSTLTETMMKEHIDDLYKPIDTLTLDEVKVLYNWFPKKK